MAKGQGGTKLVRPVAVKYPRQPPHVAKQNGALLLSSLRLMTLCLLILTEIFCAIAEPVVLIGLLMGLSSPGLGGDWSPLIVIALLPVLIFISVWLLIGWLERKKPRYYWLGPIVIALVAITFTTTGLASELDLLYHVFVKHDSGSVMRQYTRPR